jgi:hypothetical protein
MSIVSTELASGRGRGGRARFTARFALPARLDAVFGFAFVRTVARLVTAGAGWEAGGETTSGCGAGENDAGGGAGGGVCVRATVVAGG